MMVCSGTRSGRVRQVGGSFFMQHVLMVVRHHRFVTATVALRAVRAEICLRLITRPLVLVQCVNQGKYC